MRKLRQAHSPQRRGLHESVFRISTTTHLTDQSEFTRTRTRTRTHAHTHTHYNTNKTKIGCSEARRTHAAMSERYRAPLQLRTEWVWMLALAAAAPHPVQQTVYGTIAQQVPRHPTDFKRKTRAGRQGGKAHTLPQTLLPILTCAYAAMWRRAIPSRDRGKPRR